MRKVEGAGAADAAAAAAPSSSWTRRQVLREPKLLCTVGNSAQQCTVHPFNCSLSAVHSDSASCQLPKQVFSEHCSQPTVYTIMCTHTTVNCAHSKLYTLSPVHCLLSSVHNAQCTALSAKQCKEAASWTRRQVLGHPTAKSEHCQMFNHTGCFFSSLVPPYKSSKYQKVNLG